MTLRVVDEAVWPETWQAGKHHSYAKGHVRTNDKKVVGLVDVSKPLCEDRKATATKEGFLFEKGREPPYGVTKADVERRQGIS